MQEFEATVLLTRTNPAHKTKRTFTFTARDWDDADGLVLEHAIPRGMSAYDVTKVISLEKIL